MTTIRLNSFAILLLIPLVSLFFKAMPDSINEGPFNHRTDGGFFSDGDVVPNTLYFNNNTDYYTIWDDKLEKYITYNKSDNYKLDKVVFNAPETGKVSDRLHLIKGWEYVVKTSDGLRNSPRIVIANNKIMPTSHLDAEGMKIQEQYGCAGCHEM
ncbi:hypothetical protein JCM30471_04850 [Desulfuromonas carbonis]